MEDQFQLHKYRVNGRNMTCSIDSFLHLSNLDVLLDRYGRGAPGNSHRPGDCAYSDKYDYAYDIVIKRVEDQDPYHVLLPKKAILYVAIARRSSSTAQEPQRAIATEAGDVELKQGGTRRISDVVTSCHGLDSSLAMFNWTWTKKETTL